jgi:hypothetical protein
VSAADVDEAAANAWFRQWMRGNLARAADQFGLSVTGEPTFGWRLRSISAPATGADGRRWLRVVSEQPQWARGDSWTGNADANTIAGLPKPTVLDVIEWDEGSWRRQRAEVMTVVPGEPCSADDVLQTTVELPAGWWAELRASVDRLRHTPTDRINTDQERIDRRVRMVFGPRVQVRVDQWETVHGDLHWHNLHSPELGLVDWELWGRGPAGADAATLLCYSLLVPQSAERVQATFADVLDTPAGRTAQVVAAARLLARAADGDHPELVGPLQRHVRTLTGAD